SRLRGNAFRFASRDRHDKQIGVCADGLYFVGHGRETELFAIRRKSNVCRAATLIRWHVVVGSGREIAWGSATIRENNEQMAPLALIPMGPVPVEEMLGDVRLHFVLVFLPVALAVAVVVLAIGIYRRSERNRLPGRRPLHQIRSRRQFCEALRFSALQRKQIHLRIAASRRKKSKCPAIG